MSATYDKVTQVKALVSNFQEQLAGLLALPDLEEFGVQNDQVPEKSSSRGSQMDPKLMKLSDLAEKMADVVDRVEAFDSVEYAGDAEMYDCDTKERLLPGPVVVCGPPGTEPVSGQWKSQTRFDDKESLVYSRVSQDMSISRGFIHKSGCLQYIPPKDTPPVTAEVFAKPWSQKKRVPRSGSPKYYLSSSSSSPRSSRSPSFTSDDTTVSFDNFCSPYSPQRLTRMRARLRNRNGRTDIPSKSSTAATSSVKSKRTLKPVKKMNANDLAILSSSEHGDEEVDVQPSKRGKKVNGSQPISKPKRVSSPGGSDNKLHSAAQEDSKNSVGCQITVAEAGGANERQEMEQITDNGGNVSDVFGDIVAANVDITTSPEPPKSQHSDRTEVRAGDIVIRFRSPSESSLSSVNSNMPRLVDDLQEGFNRKSNMLRQKKEKQTNIMLGKLRSRSTSIEPSFSERGSSLEPGSERESRGKVNLRKKPQVVVSKLNFGGIQKKLATPLLPLDSKPVTFVKDEVQSDSSEEFAGTRDSTPVMRSPVPRQSPRETPERVLRSGKTRVVKSESTKGGSMKKPDSSKGEKAIKAEESKAEKDTKKKKEGTPVKMAKKEKKHTDSVSSCDSFSSSNIDISITDVENVIPSCPSSAEETPVPKSKSRSTTPKIRSPVKRTPEKSKQVLSQSQLSSDSDFDETPVKKKRKKMVMQRCSSEDEERPVIQTTPLTVRFSCKGGSLKVSSEERECEDTSTLMDWESWNKKNKKKLETGASRSKAKGSEDMVKVTDDSDDSDGPCDADDQMETTDSKKPLSGEQNGSEFKAPPENSISRSTSPAVAPVSGNSHSNTPSDCPEYTVSVTEVKPSEEDFPPEISCKACGRSIQWATQHVHNHPRLEVIICQHCHSVVNSGEFSLGETNEEYCSLCGDGGHIVLCDYCEKSFCYSCIARISGQDHLKHLLKDEEAAFKCYICDGEPLREAREFCRKLAEHLKKSKVPSIRACFRKKKKNKTSANGAKDDETANKEGDDGGDDNEAKKEDLDSEKKSKSERKKRWSLRSKAALTPATVEDEEDMSSDASHRGGKSPEVNTDDVMSDSNLGEELAKRKERKKLAKQANKDPKNENHSSDDDSAGGVDADASDSSKTKKKVRKRRKNLLDRCSSQIEDDSSDSGSETSSSSSEANVKDTKKTSSSSSESEEEVKTRKESKTRSKKSRIASYASGSESESDRALQIQVSDHSENDEGDKVFDHMKDSTPEAVEYRIAGDSDSSSDSPLTSDIEPVQRKKKRRDPLKTLTTSDDEDSEGEPTKAKKKRSRKRKRDENSPKDSDDDDFVDDNIILKGRSRRRRQFIKRLLTSDSEDEEDEEDDNKDEDDDEEVTESQEDPKGKKRRKIRKLIGDTKLASETKQAVQEEKERAERLKKRKQLAGEEEKEDRLVLEQDPKTKEVKLELRRSLVPHLKPHQRDGVKFLYDACVESIDRLVTGQGTGAILAHCMGLGKTLQLIGFVDALLCCDKDVVKRVLILCPINTIYNWKAEFLKWIAYKDMEYNLYLLNEPNIRVSLGKMRKWYFNGGVLLMGYERFRNLALCKRTKRAKQKAELQKFLLSPGPDLVVCDEGHVMRNSNSSTSLSINMIRTKLRVILTGTPLQNNLQEYYTMVNFVKPNLLGTPREFKNRFVNPITNGQCRDSSAEDIRMMKHRAHVLFSMLRDAVQRRDFRVLSKTLPPKLEYVLNIRLSPVQDSLYKRYLDGFDGFKSTSLFSTFAALAKIWNHPWVLKMDEQRKMEREERRELYGLSEDDEDGVDETLGGFIVSDSEEEDDFDARHKKHKKNNKSKKHPVASSSSSISSTPTPLTPVVQNGPNGPISISSDSDPDLPKIKIKPEPGTSISSSAKAAEAASTSVENGPTSRRSGEKSQAGEEKQITNKTEKPSTWYEDLLGEGADEKLDMSGKLVFLFELLEQTRPLKEKVLVFSQSLLTLDLIEEFLSRPEWGDYIRAVDYCRLDGSSAADTRTANMTEFNKIGNDRLRLFLISTRAGSLGVNLVAANRVVIFDACWNPSHDLQAIFRTYRYGQKKPVFVYRLLAQGTMEEKIYDRQVTKESLSMRVVDEKQIGRHFTASDLAELFTYTPAPPDPESEEPKNISIENDIVLNTILDKIRAKWVVSYHQHDSLLEHIDQEELSEEERQEAWQQYKQQMNMDNARYNLEVLQNVISSVAPATPQPQQGMPPGMSAPPLASAAGMPGVPGNSVNTGGFQINPYDTFKVKNVTGLVSQALDQVNQIKMNYSNLQHLKLLCANVMGVPQIHRNQMARLQGLVNQGTHDLHSKIQLINDAIARFQACPLSMHPMYTSVVNEYRQTLYKALEELRLIAGGNQPMPSSGVHMSAVSTAAPVVQMVSGGGGRVGGLSHVTSTTDLM